MEPLPNGTVTLLFTDVEGSTRLLQRQPDRYGDLLAEHRALLRAAFTSHGGREVGTQGDSFFVAFGRAREAVAAAIDGQAALAAHAWPDGGSVRVRMGLHTGEPSVSAEGYVGLGVHRAARICAAGHGGQVLLSDATRQLIEDDTPAGVELRDLGTHPLKDLDRPEHLFQALPLGAHTDFPPLNVVAPGRAQEHAARDGRARRNALRSHGSRAPAALLAAAAVTVLLAVVLALRGVHDASTPEAAAFPASGDSLAGFASGKRRPDVAVPLVGRPTAMAASGGRVFVTTVASAALTVIDGRLRRIAQTLPLRLHPDAVAVATDRVYVLDARGTVEGFRIGYERTVVRIAYRQSSAAEPGRAPQRHAASLAAAGGVLWATDGSRMLRRIDPRSRRVTSIPVDRSLAGVASGDGAVWAFSSRPASVVRVDTHTSRVTNVIPIVTRSGFDAPFPIGMATTPGTVWVLNGNTGSVTRIDTHQRGVVGTVPIGMDRAPRGIAASGRTVWVANADGSLSYLRPGHGTPSSLWIGQSLGAVAAEGATVWVTSTALDEQLPGGDQ